MSVIDTELLEAAILVVSKAEIMAKMRDERHYKGCTASYIATILTQGDERFNDRNLHSTRWDIIDLFIRNKNKVRQISGQGASEPRWTTLSAEKWSEHFK